VFRADFHVQGKRRKLAGASVRFAGRRGRTGDNGKAVIAARLRPGRHVARATKRGIRRDTAAVRARRQ
jgi:hypothetical protein